MTATVEAQLGRIEGTLTEIRANLDRVQGQLEAFIERCADHRIDTGKLETRVESMEAAIAARMESRAVESDGSGISKKLVAVIAGLVALVTTLVNLLIQ